VSDEQVTKSYLQETLQKALAPFATKAELTAFATKVELEAAVAKLATKAELEAAVAKLATKAELEAAVAKLVTKEEFEARIETLATKEELSKGLTKVVDDMRHCFGLAVEEFRKDFASFHNAFKSVDEQGKKIETETGGRFNEQDHRLTIVDTDVYKINERLVQAAKALGGSAVEAGTHRVAESA
jgi:hypothetical protein